MTQTAKLLTPAEVTAYAAYAGVEQPAGAYCIQCRGDLVPGFAYCHRCHTDEFQDEACRMSTTDLLMWLQDHFSDGRDFEYHETLGLVLEYYGTTREADNAEAVLQARGEDYYRRRGGVWLYVGSLRDSRRW